MFGLFRKKQEEPHLRGGVEVGEMRENALTTVATLAAAGGEPHSFQQVGEDTATFTYRGLTVTMSIVANLLGLSLTTRVPECNALRAGSVAEKAFAYRCIDHVCSTCAGVRAQFDPVSGELVLGVESAGFDRQFRADTLIDVALFMLEEGVMAARAYLGLPFTEAARPSVSQWLGGFHYGEGFNVYPTATDAFAVFMRKKYQAEELSRDATSILLASGPLRFDVRFFGWRFGYMVETATRGFRHAVMDGGRYVRIQERLSRPVREPGNAGDSGWNFRDPAGSAIAYFRPDGTFVVGEYGFGNAKTEENGAAFERVATRHLLNIRYMTFLAEEFPEELYSDESNRPN